MKLFELFATLALDTSEFDNGVSKSESKWNTFGEKLSGGLSKVGNVAKSLYSGVFGGNLGAWIRNIADEASAAGDKIDKQSQALGMSRKAYQEWDYILSQSGASIDSLGVSMKTLNSAVLNTLADPKKNKDMVGVFDELGLSLAELNGLTQESQLEKVVRAFQQLPAGADKSALAVKLFGRNGQDLLPLLNSSADSIDEMRQRAEELGLIMGDDAIDAAVAYNDALDDMDRTFKAMKYTVGAEFMPVMANMFRNVASYTGGLLNAYKKEGFSGVFKKIGSDIGGALSNIEWPKWSDIKEKAQSWWDNDIKSGLANILVAVFGVDTEDAESVIDTIKALWDLIEGTVEGIFKVIFQVLTGDWSAVVETISSWWSDDVWPLIKTLFSAMFGIEVPDWSVIANKIRATWERAKAAVGRLFVGAEVDVSSTVHESSSGRLHGGGSGQGFATGLDYVPYNEFPAYLHEGEAVLTKTEATEWRRGIGQQSFDMPELIQTVSAAVREGMRGFGFYVDGQRLADATSEPVSRNIAAAAIAGRYIV